MAVPSCMHIVDRMQGDVTLTEAALLAGCSTKTVRRAILDGHFPRRYVMSPRGPHLVIQRADLDRWLVARQATSPAGTHPASAQRPGSPREWSGLPAKVAHLQTALDENRAAIAALTAKLYEGEDAIARVQATALELIDRLVRVEAGRTEAWPADPEPEPTPQATSEAHRQA